MNKEAVEIPNFDSLKEIGCIMSNFDREIHRDIEEELTTTDNTYALYPGWNFCGVIWFDKLSRRFHCLVRVHLSNQGIYTASTLEEIMKTVSDEYGYD